MSNETKKTAVELFAISLYEKGFLTGNGDEIQELLQQAKKMEKEQIEKAFATAMMKENNSDYIGMNEEIYSEIYYNETYGGNK